MKYLKMLGLLLVAAAAFMAFAGSAFAVTTVTSPTGTAYGTGAANPIVAEGEGHVTLDNPIASIPCQSSVSGHLKENAASPANGPITGLSFGVEGVCTNSWHVTVVSGGELELVADATGAEKTGTLYSQGATVEATRFGVTCRYATSTTTKIGTATGTNTTGATATLDIVASIPFHSGSFLCGEGATTWTGSYKVTGPDSLWIDG